MTKEYIMELPVKAIPFRLLPTGDLFQFNSALGSLEVRRKVSLTKYRDVSPHAGTRDKRIGKERPVIALTEHEGCQPLTVDIHTIT